MNRILSMSIGATETSEFRVMRTPRRFWFKRWWLWFCVVAFALILLCYQGGKAWNNYQREKFRQFSLKLNFQGIYVSVRSVDSRFAEPRWIHRNQKYLPSFIIELLASQETSVRFVGANITTESLSCLTKLPNVTSITFKDTPNINDDSLAHLSNLESLSWLNIDSTSISGEGFIHLQNLPQLGLIQISPKNSLTEKGIDQLFVMKPRIHVYDLKAESVKPGNVEITGPNGSHSIKAGDLVTFRGSFTSTHFAPGNIHVSLYPLDETKVEKSVLLSGIITEPITKDANGIYHFNVTTKKAVTESGRYKAEIDFAVFQEPHLVTSEIWFTLCFKEFEVKKE